MDAPGGMNAMGGMDATGGMNAMGGMTSGGEMGTGGMNGIRPLCDDAADPGSRCEAACDFWARCVGDGACPGVGEGQGDAARAACTAECAASPRVADTLCADQACSDAVDAIAEASPILAELCGHGGPPTGCWFDHDCADGAREGCQAECVQSTCLNFCEDPNVPSCDAMCGDVVPACRDAGVPINNAFCLSTCNDPEVQDRFATCARRFILNAPTCDSEGLWACLMPTLTPCENTCTLELDCMPDAAFEIRDCLDACRENDAVNPGQVALAADCANLHLAGNCDMEAYQACVEPECTPDQPCPPGGECVAGVCQAIPAPEFGTCADPFPLQLGIPIEGSTREGAPSRHSGGGFEGCPASTNAAPENVYGFVADEAEYCLFLESEFDGVLYVTTGENCNDLNMVGCNDDHMGQTTSQVSLSVNNRGAYHRVMVDGFGQGAHGNYALTVTPGPCRAELDGPCEANPDCVEGLECVENRCTDARQNPGCGDGPACGPNEECRAGLCVRLIEPELECRLDVECERIRQGFVCIEGSCQDSACSREVEPQVIDFMAEANGYEDEIEGRQREVLFVETELRDGMLAPAAQCVESRVSRRPAQTIFRFVPRHSGQWSFSTAMGPESRCAGRCPPELRCVNFDGGRCTPQFDPIMEVRRACDIQNSGVRCDDDFNNQINAPSFFTELTAGQAYYVIVSAHTDAPETRRFVLSTSFLD